MGIDDENNVEESYFYCTTQMVKMVYIIYNTFVQNRIG